MALVFLLFCLFKVSLVHVELDSQDGGAGFVFVFAGWICRVVWARLEKWSNRVNHEENYENVVKVEASLLCLSFTASFLSISTKIVSI